MHLHIIVWMSMFYSILSFETDFLNKNIGKVYPRPYGNLTPQSPSLRRLSFIPRPFDTPKKIYFVDIDGTICENYKKDYYISTPKMNIIRYVNQLYDEGNEIHYWTTRGSVSGKNWDTLTLQQLKSWNCKYDSVNIGKPHYDGWIDDKSIHVKDIV